MLHKKYELTTLDNDGLPVPQRYGAILAIALGIAVSVIDGAIANVALPSIARDFQASPASSIWVVNAYQLAITISLLSLASLGEIVGYRRIYQLGLLMFSMTSLCCALADSLMTMTIARVLQGFGAAAIMSVNIVMVRMIYPQRYLGRGMGINALVVGVSSAAGPTVAAVILSFTTWQWLFAINLPIGLLAFCLGLKFLPANPVKNTGQHFDMISSLMNALTFGLLISAISGYAQGQAHSITLGEVILLVIVGWFFIRRQLSHPSPLLPVDLLQIPIFSLSICASLCSFTAQMLAFVSLPFFLQHRLGLDAVSTGLLLTPWPLAAMVFAPIAGRLVERYQAGILGGIGLMVFACGLYALALLPSNSSHLNIIWRMVLCGAGFGLFQSPNNYTIISSAPRRRSGGASGMLGTARLLGQTTGAALVALMFNLFGNHGTHASLILGGTLALGGAVLSLMRMTQKSANQQKD